MPYQISNHEAPAYPSHLQPPLAHFCPQLPRSKPGGLEQDLQSLFNGRVPGSWTFKANARVESPCQQCEGADPHRRQSQWPHPGSTLAEDLGSEASALTNPVVQQGQLQQVTPLAANNTSNAHLLRGQGKGLRSFNCSK